MVMPGTMTWCGVAWVGVGGVGVGGDEARFL